MNAAPGAKPLRPLRPSPDVGGASLHSAEGWKSEGGARLAEGEFKAAADCFTRGLEAARREGLAGGRLVSQLHSGRAQALLRLGDAARALEDCEAAIAGDPFNAKAYWRGGTAAMRLDSPAVAADLCRRGISAVGDSPSLQALLEEAEAVGGQAGGFSPPSRARGPGRSAPGGESQQADGAKGGDSSANKDSNGAAAGMAQDLAERGATLLERYRAAGAGERCEEDVQRARRLFERSLREDRANMVALLGMGDLLDAGLGCPRDPALAGQLYMAARVQGSRKAEVKLSLLGLDKLAGVVRRSATGEPAAGNGT